MPHQLSNLKDKTGAQLIAAFATIPQRATSLDLSSNHLYNRSGAEFAAAFVTIPQSVRSLDLSINHFYHKTGAELAAVFSVIPQSVTSLDLRWNHLGNLSHTELVTALTAIPSNISEITLSLDDIENRTKDELISLGKALPYVMAIKVLDEHEKITEHPSVKILRSFIGQGIVDTYCAIYKDEESPQLIKDVTYIILSYITDAKEKQLTSFVVSRLPPRQQEQKKSDTDVCRQEKKTCLKSVSSSISAFFTSVSTNIAPHQLSMDCYDKHSSDNCNIQ